MVAAAFQGKSRPDQQAEQQRIEFLEKKIQTKDEVLAELMAEHIAQKKGLGALTKCGCRRRAGQVVDFVRCWSEKPRSAPDDSSTGWGVRASKFYDWRERYGARQRAQRVSIRLLNQDSGFTGNIPPGRLSTN